VSDIVFPLLVIALESRRSIAATRSLQSTSRGDIVLHWCSSSDWRSGWFTNLPLLLSDGVRNALDAVEILSLRPLECGDILVGQPSHCGSMVAHRLSLRPQETGGAFGKQLIH
jgi:hypothetical protein